jgi:SNF2 family DNA or RNA helicase
MRQTLTPHEYQHKAIKWLLSHPEGAALLDLGLGKTMIALMAFCAMRRAGQGSALVIAPKNAAESVWTQNEGGEIAKWANFEHLKVSLLRGPKREEALFEPADLYVMNYEAILWLFDVDNRKLLTRFLKESNVDTAIFDELSRLKSTKSKRYKAIKPYLRKFKRRWGLTGTPVSNGLLDLFGQMFVIDLGRSLGPFITKYRTKFFVPTGYTNGWHIQDGAAKKIHKLIRKSALSIRASDHLDLPDLIETNTWVTLPPKARIAYDEMEDQLFTLLDNTNEVTAVNAAAANGKCRQIASGGVYYEQLTPKGVEKKYKKVHDQKSQVLKELVNELQGSPVIVAYDFIHDFTRIKEVLGDVPALNGQTKANQSVGIINAWNRGELPILAGHPASMAHGLNLQSGGSHIIWYSPTWNLEYYKQLIGRLWRQGQTSKRVVVTRILARNTVDEVVIRRLAQKDRVQESLLNALKKYKNEVHQRRGRRTYENEPTPDVKVKYKKRTFTIKKR